MAGLSGDFVVHCTYHVVSAVTPENWHLKRCVSIVPHNVSLSFWGD